MKKKSNVGAPRKAVRLTAKINFYCSPNDKERAETLIGEEENLSVIARKAFKIGLKQLEKKRRINDGD